MSSFHYLGSRVRLKSINHVQKEKYELCSDKSVTKHITKRKHEVENQTN